MRSGEPAGFVSRPVEKPAGELDPIVADRQRGPPLQAPIIAPMSGWPAGSCSCGVRFQPLRASHLRHLPRSQSECPHDRLRLQRMKRKPVAFEKARAEHEPRPLVAIEKRMIPHDAHGIRRRQSSRDTNC